MADLRSHHCGDVLAVDRNPQAARIRIVEDRVFVRLVERRRQHVKRTVFRTVKFPLRAILASDGTDAENANHAEGQDPDTLVFPDEVFTVVVPTYVVLLVLVAECGDIVDTLSGVGG